MLSEKPNRYNGLDRAIGTVGANLAEKLLLNRVEYQGVENIDAANRMLRTGGSALVVPDHSDLVTTMYSANLILKLDAAQRGVVMTKAYETGQMGNMGRVALRIVDHYGVEPIFVMTKKYVPDYQVRQQYNEGQKETIKNFLRTPGNALLMYPEGTRQYEMGEARRGFSEFAPEATAVVPLTTVTEKGRPPRVIVHEPIPARGGIARCNELFGEENGPQVFSDLVMTVIALGQPNEKKRGAYRETSVSLEQFLNGPADNMSETGDLRSRSVIAAFIAWKSGEFGSI